MRKVLVVSALFRATALSGHFGERDPLQQYVDPDDRPAMRAVQDAYGTSNFWRVPAGYCGKCVSNKDQELIMAVNREKEWLAGIYGEILPDSILSLLRSAGARPGMRFYDLGSGTGKFVAIAKQVLGLEATGIELSSDRHQLGCKALAALDRPEGSGPGGSAKLVHGSFFDYDFSDADIVFIDNVEYTEDMNKRLARLASSMKKGSALIIATAWTTPDFDAGTTLTARSTWDEASMLVLQRKVTEAGRPTGLPRASAAGEQCNLGS